MARSVGSGIYATISWSPLKVVVAVQLWFSALSTVIPFLITVSTGGIAGESIAAGMAGVVAVRLQKKQPKKKKSHLQVYFKITATEKEEERVMEVPTAQQELFYLQVLDRYVWELNSTNFIPTQCACSALGAHKQLSQGCGSHALTMQENWDVVPKYFKLFPFRYNLLSLHKWHWLSCVDFDLFHSYCN